MKKIVLYMMGALCLLAQNGIGSDQRSRVSTAQLDSIRTQMDPIITQILSTDKVEDIKALEISSKSVIIEVFRSNEIDITPEDVRVKKSPYSKNVFVVVPNKNFFQIYGDEQFAKLLMLIMSFSNPGQPAQNPKYSLMEFLKFQDIIIESFDFLQEMMNEK